MPGEMRNCFSPVNPASETRFPSMLAIHTGTAAVRVAALLEFAGSRYREAQPVQMKQVSNRKAGQKPGRLSCGAIKFFGWRREQFFFWQIEKYGAVRLRDVRLPFKINSLFVNEIMVTRSSNKRDHDVARADRAHRNSGRKWGRIACRELLSTGVTQFDDVFAGRDSNLSFGFKGRLRHRFSVNARNPNRN